MEVLTLFDSTKSNKRAMPWSVFKVPFWVAKPSQNLKCYGIAECQSRKRPRGRGAMNRDRKQTNEQDIPSPLRVAKTKLKISVPFFYKVCTTILRQNSTVSRTVGLQTLVRCFISRCFFDVFSFLKKQLRFCIVAGQTPY